MMLNNPLANPVNWYKMRIVTIFISAIAILFLVGEVFSNTYIGAVIVSVKGDFSHFTDIFCEPDDDIISDKVDQPDFFSVSGATADNGYPPFGSFFIAEIWKAPRLNVLLDYESRAP